jgi:hypothetical protein
MAIIEDYDAISRRLHELLTTSPKGVNDITDLERWRNLARETAQEYVENRHREAVIGARFGLVARGSSMPLACEQATPCL